MIKTRLGLYKKTKRITREFSKRYYSIHLRNKPKIFCIGLNKTGTTSLGKAMKDLGFVVGNQTEAELLFNDWVQRDFKKIIKYCHTAEFFQDIPFSYPYTYAVLDHAFPKSKFILTVRDSPEQWYNSLINFHGKLFGNGKIPPTAEDLKQGQYLYKGFIYDSMKKLLNVPDEDIYNRDILIENYKMHTKIVLDYFNFRKEDLLVLNVGEKGSYEKLCNFLKLKCDSKDFPWENKT